MDNLSEKTVPELREIAEELEIEDAAAMKKIDLIAAIEERQTHPAKPPAAEPNPEPAAPPEADPDPEAAGVEAGQAGEPRPDLQKNRRPLPSEAWRSFLEEVGEALDDDEQAAITTLERHGWKIFFNAKIEDSQERSFKRSFRNEGRYVITVARKDLVPVDLEG